MENKKKIRFRLPQDFFLPEKAESWLEEKAAEGWFLSSLGRKSAIFLEGKPEAVVYMLVPMDPDDSRGPEEQGGEYKRFGWEYVTQLRRMILVLRGSCGQCERIQELKGESIYRKLQKRLKGSAWGFFTPFLFWVSWIIGSGYFQGYGILLLMVKSYSWLIFLAMGVCGLLQAGNWREASLVRRLLSEMESRFEKELRDGREEEGQERTESSVKRKGFLLYRVMLTVFLICTAIGILEGAGAAVSRRKLILDGSVAEAAERGWEEGGWRMDSFLKRHPSWNTISPAIIPLTQIENVEDMEYRKDSYTLLSGSFLAPVQAEVMQYTDWEEQGNYQEGTMKLEYYQLRSEGLARSFMNELGKYYMHWYKGWVPKKVESAFFDELVIHDGGLHYLFARKGNQVIFSYYLGDELLEDHTEEFERAVSLLGDS